MPSTSVKKLYLASNVQDLDAKSKIDVNTRATKHLITLANKLMQNADKFFLDQDEEMAYVQYMKYVELIVEVRGRTDFTKNSSDGKLLYLNANTALAKAENLRASLSKRYSILQEATCQTKNEKNEMLNALHNKKSEPTPPSKSPITEVPPPADIPKYSISSKDLFQLFTSMQSIIIMDIRPATDFEDSHIKHNKCINIPEKILEPGTTAAKLESMLPKESLSMWYKRGEVDYIVIVDWDSKDETTPSIPVKALKEAMCKWDLHCPLEKNPMILEGGYKDWMLTYPMYTTQALIFSVMSETSLSPKIADLSVIEYPDLDENSPKSNNTSSNENLNGPGPLFHKTPVPNQIVGGSNSSLPRTTKSAPNIDRKSKPTTDKAPKSAALGVRKLYNSNDVTNNKFVVNGEDKISPSERRRSSEERMVLENLETAKLLLANEKEMENLRLRKALEAEESKRIEVQKQEDRLFEKIKMLESELSAKDAKIHRMKKIIVEGKHIPKEKENINEAESTKKKLLDEVEKLREQRKKQETLAKKKVESSNSNGVPREIASANSALKRSTNHQNHHNNSLNTEYTLPLSRENSVDGGSRGLVRSHSSPNIAQMVNQEDSPVRKTPTVDRSLKPTATPTYQIAEINRARHRNLHPIFGNPVRPATGLRNLGNTCFMNSIIQCLSNTVPLADYFNSGQYMEDINRDNKQGTGGDVAEEFAVVIKALWMGQYKSFSPKDFKNTVSRCLSVCIGNEQQDSHEFLVVLMEKLHADLNKKSIRPIPKLESSVDEASFWQHHKRYNSSTIANIFEGLLKSTLTCLSCRQTSDSFEVFSCLSLPMLASRCSLKDCFQHFLKSEKICGEAAWDCPRCKQKKEAEKRLHICRLPEVLVIQLKRFSYEGLWRRKLQTLVDFDHMFDVPYQKNSTPASRTYNLYGIVNHFGTLEGGHYTAYCNANTSRKWYKYDDHEVSEVSSSDITTSAAYLLFYRAVEFHSNL